MQQTQDLIFILSLREDPRSNGGPTLGPSTRDSKPPPLAGGIWPLRLSRGIMTMNTMNDNIDRGWRLDKQYSNLGKK